MGDLKGTKTYEDLKALIAKRKAQSERAKAANARKREEKAARKAYVRSLKVHHKGHITRAKKSGVPIARIVQGGRPESKRSG